MTPRHIVIIASLIETEAKLLHDEEFQRRLATTAEQQAALLGSFARAQADGRMRDDLDATDLVRFTTMVVNGLALRVAVGDPTDVGTVLTLVNDALRPRD